MIFIIHIIVSYDQNISLIIYVTLPTLHLHYRPVTVHCSTKDAYTSEITFLALDSWLNRWRSKPDRQQSNLHARIKTLVEHPEHMHLKAIMNFGIKD